VGLLRQCVEETIVCSAAAELEIAEVEGKDEWGRTRVSDGLDVEDLEIYEWARQCWNASSYTLRLTCETRTTQQARINIPAEQLQCVDSPHITEDGFTGPGGFVC
jgi:hypothetical protein